MRLLLTLTLAAALSAQTLGSVHFSNSGNAAAQAPFLRGLALLHNFEYDDAAEHFRKAQQIAPDFALAFWGEAMTKNHPLWHEEDVSAARVMAPARSGETISTSSWLKTNRSPRARRAPRL